MINRCIPSNYILQLLGYTIIFCCLLANVGCAPLEVKRTTRLITKEVAVVSAIEVAATGDIIDIGEPLLDHGHCWAVSPSPTIDSSRSSLGGTNTRGVFTTAVTNLNPDTQYYVRAYLMTATDTLYGDDIKVTTPETTPPPVTTGVSNISKNEATVGGAITILGKNTITQHGHCWATTVEPTIANSHTLNGTVNTKGNFSSALGSLQPNTLYYVRTYAQSIGGITYGNQTSFRTPKN